MKTKYREESLNRLNSSFNKNYEICVVYHDKGKTPRFHIIDIKTRGLKFDCKISLLTLKQLKGDKLSINQYNKLISFLRTPNEIFPEMQKDKLWDLKCEWCSSNKIQLKV